MTKRIGLLVNPTSGKGRGAAMGAQVAARLAAQGNEVIHLSDVSAASARERALAGIVSGLDVLAITGGDGMVNLGVNLCAGRRHRQLRRRRTLCAPADERPDSACRAERPRWPS